MKRYQRKGFTLLELIIVIALFSIIMVSVVKLLDPVSKFFVRSSNFETTNACIDNMRRSIEGNLQYADRVWLCEKKTPYEYTPVPGVTGVKKSDYAATDDLKDKVTQFYTTYFLNRKFLDCIGSIYVLVFDNTQIATDTGLKNYQILNDINANMLNSGKMVRYEFKFDNYKSDDPADCLTLTPYSSTNTEGYTVTPWYVNQSLYGNFEYKYTLGSLDAEYDDTGHVIFNPMDCTISITMNEIKKSPDGLVRDEEGKTNTASFSMKNVLDAAKKYQTPLDDYIIEEGPGYGDPTKILDWFVRNSTPQKRFDRITWTTTDSFDGFYFIYTMPETTYDVTDKEVIADDGITDLTPTRYTNAIKEAKDYLQAVKDKYNP